jgi:hypothetical protein
MIGSALRKADDPILSAGLKATREQLKVRRMC